MRVVLVVVFLPGIRWAQLTTGVVEGTLRSPDGRPLAGTVLTVTGDPGFQTEVRSRGDGGFALVLPYGSYRFSDEIVVSVAPLQITRLDLVMDPLGILHSIDQQSALATREPSASRRREILRTERQRARAGITERALIDGLPAKVSYAGLISLGNERPSPETLWHGKLEVVQVIT